MQPLYLFLSHFQVVLTPESKNLCFCDNGQRDPRDPRITIGRRILFEARLDGLTLCWIQAKFVGSIESNLRIHPACSEVCFLLETSGFQLVSGHQRTSDQHKISLYIITVPYLHTLSRTCKATVRTCLKMIIVNNYERKMPCKNSINIQDGYLFDKNVTKMLHHK